MDPVAPTNNRLCSLHKVASVSAGPPPYGQAAAVEVIRGHVQHSVSVCVINHRVKLQRIRFGGSEEPRAPLRLCVIVSNGAR